MRYIDLFNYVGIGLLALAVVSFTVMTIVKYEQYGFTYEVKTIIGDEETVRTESLSYNVMTNVLLVFFLLLLIVDTINIKEQKPFTT